MGVLLRKDNIQRVMSPREPLKEIHKNCLGGEIWWWKKLRSFLAMSIVLQWAELRWDHFVKMIWSWSMIGSKSRCLQQHLVVWFKRATEADRVHAAVSKRQNRQSMNAMSVSSWIIFAIRTFLRIYTLVKPGMVYRTIKIQRWPSRWRRKMKACEIVWEDLEEKKKASIPSLWRFWI